jgi:hypothetical protein
MAASEPLAGLVPIALGTAAVAVRISLISKRSYDRRGNGTAAL